MIEKQEKILRKIDDLLLCKFNLLNGVLETSLDNLIQIESGNRPVHKSDEPSKQFCYALYGSSKIMGFCDNWNYDEDILMIGRVGTLGIVQRTNKKCWISDNVLTIKSKYLNYIQQVLKNIDYSSINRGSSQPLITQTDIKKIKVNIPNNQQLNEYEDYAKNLQIIKYNIIDRTNNLILIKHYLLKKYFG